MKDYCNKPISYISFAVLFTFFVICFQACDNQMKTEKPIGTEVDTTYMNPGVIKIIKEYIIEHPKYKAYAMSAGLRHSHHATFYDTIVYIIGPATISTNKGMYYNSQHLAPASYISIYDKYIYLSSSNDALMDFKEMKDNFAKTAVKRPSEKLEDFWFFCITTKGDVKLISKNYRQYYIENDSIINDDSFLIDIK